MFGQSDTSEMALPQFEASVPVSVYVNGKVVPPIEANGQITSFNLSGLQMRCSQKIPIPAVGELTFKLGHQRDELKLKVNFVSRVEVGKRGWFRSDSDYELKATFDNNSREVADRFQHHFHRLLFGGNMVGTNSLSPAATDSDF